MKFLNHFLIGVVLTFSAVMLVLNFGLMPSGDFVWSPSNELAASEEGQRWVQWSSFTGETKNPFALNPDFRSAGIILSTTTPDDASSEAIASTLQQLHGTPDRNQLWSAKLSSKLTALKEVQFAWVFPIPSSANERNLAAVTDELTEIGRKITIERENIKAYEVETALKKTELERQWAESLLRQSTEDAQHLASLRAQAEQEHRLRLEAARLQQAKIRREGAAALDSARMNYLKQLNQILNESGAEDLLILLEKNQISGQDQVIIDAPEQPVDGTIELEDPITDEHSPEEDQHESDK